VAAIAADDLTNVDGTLYFEANDGAHGQELWKSDGTAAGTLMVKDINPGSSGSEPYDLTNVNGTLYFDANDGTDGFELWKSDGTAAGTVMVKDIDPGSGSSAPFNLTNVNDTLYFAADDGTDGTELWKSDGTTAGTVMVKDIVPGSGSSSPFDLAAVNGAVEFYAFDGTSTGLFRSDGTAAGTIELATNIQTTTPLGVTGFPDGDFNGDSFSDILWQNANGQAATWELDGTSQIAGGSQLVGPNPGPGWTAVGTGDFNGDGHSDILWQNIDGQVAIWEMNGVNQIAGGSQLVGADPGPDWKVVGTGDFNGDGHSDILWQNTDGQVAIWEMNGTSQIAGGSQLVGANPGPDWKVVGTGDFNGDGYSDILFQNSDGQAAIWEMNGTNQIAGGGQLVGPNPGPDWKAVGTGDFNGDGHSDILWQNTDGQVAIWEMNGANQIPGGSQLVGANPGPDWKVVGTGDFNGDGYSDILFQNSDGQAAIWEMNGTNQIAGGGQLVGPNPGSAWRAVGV
jgi:ELWxxDGT repeat protein